MGNRKNRAKQSFLLYHDSRDLFAKLSPEDCQTLIVLHPKSWTLLGCFL